MKVLLVRTAQPASSSGDTTVKKEAAYDSDYTIAAGNM